MPERVSVGALACVAAILPLAAFASDIYVSPTGSDKSAGSSTTSPLATIAAASKRAVAGDTIHLLPGQYSEAIIPQASGTANHPITYEGSSDKAAVISNVNIGILVSSKSYLVFDGISVNGTSLGPNASVNTFLAIQNSSYVTVRHCNFKYANGWAGVDISARYSPDGRYWGAVPETSLQLGTTAHITLEDNSIDAVGSFSTLYGDAIQVAFGDVRQILIQRNTITHGGHDLLDFDANASVLQNNILNNSWTDLVGGDTGYRSLEVRGVGNVVQGNYMAHSRRGGDGRAGPLASIRGSQTIARSNIMYDAINGAIQTWCGPGPADSLTSDDGRIYNNTMYQVGGTAWAVWAYTGCDSMGGWVFANNLAVDTRGSAGINVQNGVVQDADLLFAVSGGAGVVAMGRGPTAGSAVKGNLFAPAGGGPAYVLLAGAGGRMPLTQAQSQNPQLFSGNIVARPNFVSAHPSASADFRLQSGSAGLSGGAFLTTVAASGNSAQLVVKDSLYFSDGNGLIPGDTVQLQGGTQRATIVSIDRSSNTLTLSQPFTFTKGQGLALAFNGSAPDIGAGLGTTGPQPMAPSDVRVQKSH